MSGRADERSRPATLAAEVGAGLAVHRRYAVVAVVALLSGIPAGWALQASGRQLSALPLARTGNAPYPQGASVPAILESDTELFALLVVGTLTAGLLTVVGLFTQGVLVGFFVGSSAGELGAGYLLVSVAPHGLPRLVGFALAGAVGFRLLAAGIARLVGWREQVYSSLEWRRAGLVLGFGWLWLAVAAVIEAHLTSRLVELLF